MRAFLSFALLVLPLVSAKRSSHSFKKRTCPVKNSTAPASPSSSSVVSAAWYAGWHSDDFPLDSVSWDKYTHLTYSFA